MAGKSIHFLQNFMLFGYSRPFLKNLSINFSYKQVALFQNQVCLQGKQKIVWGSKTKKSLRKLKVPTLEMALPPEAEAVLAPLRSLVKEQGKKLYFLMQQTEIGKIL